MIFILHEMQIIKRYEMKIDLSFPPHIEFIFHDWWYPTQELLNMRMFF